MRDLADYIYLGENTFVVSTTVPPSTTKPSVPSGQVVVVPRPVPISQVPEDSRPLIVAYDVAEVLNAPCPWSEATKARYNELVSSPYTNAGQKEQLRAWAGKCIEKPKVPSATLPSSSVPAITWKPPEITSEYVKHTIKPSVVRPTAPVTIQPPPPSKENVSEVIAPSTLVSRPVFDLDHSSTIEELERQRVARQEQQKKDVAKLQKQLEDAQKEKQKKSDPTEDRVKAGFNKIRKELKKLGVDFNFSVDPSLTFSDYAELGPEADKKLREARRVAAGLGKLAIGIDLYKNKNFSGDISNFAKSFLDEKLNEVYKDYPKWALDKVKEDLSPIIGKIVEEVKNSLLSKYSASAFGAVADSVTNPQKSEAEQLRNARDVMAPFLAQFKKDISRIPFEVVNEVLKISKSKPNPVMQVFTRETTPSSEGYLIQREKNRVSAELNQQVAYYNQIRASDEFTAREVARDIKSLRNKLSALDKKQKEAAPVSLLQKGAAELFTEKYSVEQITGMFSELFNEGKSAATGW